MAKGLSRTQEIRSRILSLLHSADRPVEKGLIIASFGSIQDDVYKEIEDMEDFDIIKHVGGNCYEIVTEHGDKCYEPKA